MKIKGIAHRGYPTKYPENTLSSFQAALDLSFTHVELDVHLTKNNIPVVMHDPTLERMSNGKGKIVDHTLEQLKKFTVQDTEVIPTLEEALNLMKGKLTVLIELKQHETVYEGLEQSVYDIIKDLDMTSSVIITSFNPDVLRRMRELNRELTIGLLAKKGPPPDDFRLVQELSIGYISIDQSFLSQEFAALCRDHHVQLIARPIDTEDACNKMLDFPAVLASTNYAERWKQFYEMHFG